jgi:tRNA threonylcarbamoyladenosine biosynthesis protein TsaE
VLVVETSDPEETEALGAQLAADLRPGDIVLVRGELGSGKTTLVRGAARGLGVSDPVTSPTFGIGHRYGGSEVTIAHLDLYRLAGLAQEDPGLLEDYLGCDRIAFVEWPEVGDAQFGAAAMRITLTHAGGDRRRIEVCDLRGSRTRCDDDADRSRAGGGSDTHGPGAGHRGDSAKDAGA